MLIFKPCVFRCGSSYKIAVTSDNYSLAAVKAGDDIYTDNSCGIIRSACKTHIIEVPGEILDREKKYTVIEREIIKRKAYCTETKPEKEYSFDFRPVPENPRCYHIADSHNDTGRAVTAAKAYGKIDFLILNGDIIENSDTEENFYVIYKITSEITGGEIPVIVTRGNHDLRGKLAEQLANYIPLMNGNPYYSGRLGNSWFLCLDCGEDKVDDHREYGLTADFHAFRRKETEYIKEIINNKEKEYGAPGIKHKIIISHIPFTFDYPAPFNIEKEIYSEWASLIKENIKPGFMLCGHNHKAGIYSPGCAEDGMGQPCPLIVGATKQNDYFMGTGIEFKDSGCEITFTDNEGKICGRETINY